ncbi:hypothetical protein BGZ76_010835 [Entomortierella beljakovae]|nr:hypothetical protein BGZ76_010835 [Entomortierella beljakovae]
MPSQQPPHLLSAPKLTLERDRETIGSPASQDWSMSPSSNNNNNINNNNNNNNNNISGGNSIPSNNNNISINIGNSSANLTPNSSSNTTVITSRNRRDSSAGASATSSAATLVGSYSSPHMNTPLSSHLQSSFQLHTPPMDTEHSTTGTEYTGRTQRPPSTKAQDSLEHRHQGHSAAHHNAQHSQSSTLPSNLSSDYLCTPTPRRRQRTLSSHSRSRSHTPSVQLALANPTLSKSLSSSPVPSRAGSDHDQQAHAKHSFERNVRRYYYQLTVGCQQNHCAYRLCRSNKNSPKMTKDAAAILSIQLAARPRLFFCSNCPTDPIINIPDSPLPSNMGSTNLQHTAMKRCQSLSSSKPMSTKLSNGTSSCRSSPGPASSVEELGISREHRIYEPNEYSKSVPSFSVSQFISPIKNTPMTSTFQPKDDPLVSTLSSPPSLERERGGGTPLFHSLLSVSPFSAMFSPKAQPSISSNRGRMNKSLELCRTHSSSPSQRIKKSVSAGEMPHSHSPRISPPASPVRTGRTTIEGNILKPRRPRSFSPAGQSPPLSPSLNSAVESRNNGGLRICLIPRKDETLQLDPEQNLSTESISLLGDESVGLGYSSRLLHSPASFGLARLYQIQPRNQESPQNSTRRQDRLNKGVKGGKESPTLLPLFGTSRDPDSDGLDSPSSADDEQTRTEFSWKVPEHKQPTQSGQLSAPTATLQPNSPKYQLISRTDYISELNKIRRSSASSINSEGSSSGRHWTMHSQSQSLDDRISSSSSSRRSSISETEESGVALPYLNLSLLRQAIATYNSSKPGSDIRSPQLLICKGFKPTSTGMGIQQFENGAEDDNSEFRYRHGLKSDYEETLEGDHKILSLGDCEISNDIVLQYQTVAAGKPVFPDDEPRGNYEDEDEGEDGRDSMRTDTCQDNIVSLYENAPSPYFGSEAGDSFIRRRVGSPAHSMISSSTYSTEGDSTFLVDSLRSVFSSAVALGSSFLMKDREETGSNISTGTTPGGIDVGGIDLEALRDCYEMMMELKPRTIFAIQVTNSMEILLARLEMEQEASNGDKIWSEQEMRALIILLMNPFLFEQPYQESLLRRILQIFISIRDTDTLTRWLSCLDEEGMAQLVTLFKMYLSAHFSPRPTSPTHPAICAVKALAVLYDANNIGTHREKEKQRRSAIKDAREGKQNVPETSSTISFKYFYSGVMEALKFKDEYQIWRDGWNKSPSERQFSYFNYPFLLSPTSKAHILNLDALTQMSAHYEDACVRHALADHAQQLLPETTTTSAREFQKGIRAGSSPYLVLELSRAHLVEEAFEQITKKHSDLKKPLKVAFVDVGEEGMDQGGVTKEFFQIMVEKVFDSQFGLFKELEEGRSWWFEGTLDGSCRIETTEKETRIRLIEYELVGILVGLALYNGVILGVRFPSVVYRKLLGWEVDLDSFIESFPALGHGLEQMLTWTDGDVYDVFMREFEISYEHLGQVTTLPLKAGGQDIRVTNENREEYVQAYMDNYVHQHIRQEFEAFQKGFDKICGGEAIKLLRPEEMELLLCGNSDVDMHDLEASCLYDDGYNPSHTLIREFWEIVHQDLSPEQHKQLLVFVTGSDRVPIRGLKDLMFVIQRNGPDSDRLPTALTCFSRLLLPEYSSKEKMRERLITAIENSNGFGLV